MYRTIIKIVSGKSYVFILILLFVSFSGFSISPTLHQTNSAPTLVSKNIPSKAEKARMEQMRMFVNLSLKDYEKLEGKKLNVFQRFSFRLSQKRMKMMLKRYDDGDVTVLQKISWLLKGLLLGPLAVLLVYAFTSEENRDLIKWVWFGFIGWSILLVIILLALR